MKHIVLEEEYPLDGNDHLLHTLIPVSIDLCTVRRDGALDFRIKDQEYSIQLRSTRHGYVSNLLWYIDHG